MPSSKPRPAEIAAQAKQIIPNIIKNREGPVGSILHVDTQLQIPLRATSGSLYPSIVVLDADPVNVALEFSACLVKGRNDRDPSFSIPVVNAANEHTPGGDWESGLIAAEECMARRSDLTYSLKTPLSGNGSHYPIPTLGGIYTPRVVFRNGAEDDEIWQHPKTLPIISVSPVYRPELDHTGTAYSLKEERELMREKMRVVLRISAIHGHKNLCLGAFGIGPVFRNPAREVAKMWKELFFEENEFNGVFTRVVFALDSKHASPQSKVADIFREVYNADNI